MKYIYFLKLIVLQIFSSSFLKYILLSVVIVRYKRTLELFLLSYCNLVHIVKVSLPFIWWGIEPHFVLLNVDIQVSQNHSFVSFFYWCDFLGCQKNLIITQFLGLSLFSFSRTSKTTMYKIYYVLSLMTL